MDINITTTFGDDQKTKAAKEDEEEEALSLCDFPLNSDGSERRDSAKIRRSSSEPSEFFEFFNDFTSDNMCNAEDIIFCGKLVPFKNPPRFHHQILKSLSADDARRYCCDSLPELNSASRPIANRRLSRHGRAMDSRKLRRRSNLLIVKPDAADIHRSSSKGSAKSEGSLKMAKPRWFVMLFGPLKLQQEMDLRDMKNRQVRRSPGSLFPAMDAGGKAPVGRSDRRSFWGHDLLRILSCKNHASVAVTASIGLVPHF